MAVKKKTPSTQGMSKKMLKRKKPINSNYFLDVGPITDNQELFFNEWKDGNIIWQLRRNLLLQACLRRC